MSIFNPAEKGPRGVHSIRRSANQREFLVCPRAVSSSELFSVETSAFFATPWQYSWKDRTAKRSVAAIAQWLKPGHHLYWCLYLANQHEIVTFRKRVA